MKWVNDPIAGDNGPNRTLQRDSVAVRSAGMPNFGTSLFLSSSNFSINCSEGRVPPLAVVSDDVWAEIESSVVELCAEAEKQLCVN